MEGQTTIEIKTSRLTLVPVSEKHIKEIYENFNEQVVTYMAPAAAKDIEETTEVVHQFIEQREKSIGCVYAIALKSSGELDVAGILLMPLTRHQTLHLNDCCKWKELIRIRKKFFAVLAKSAILRRQLVSGYPLMRITSLILARQ